MSQYSLENINIVKIDGQNGDTKTEKEFETEDSYIQDHIITICEKKNNNNQAEKYQKNSHNYQVGFLKPGFDEDVVKVPAHQVYFGGNDEGKVPTYWIQFHLKAQELPPGAIPLDYDPSRNSFIRLVFFIVLTMLICTIGIVALIYTTPVTYHFFRKHFLYIFIGSVIAMICLHYAVYCIPAFRVPPCNIISLILAVIIMSIMSAVVSVAYSVELILMAFIATAIVVFCCLAIAMTSFDFTRFILYIIVICIAFAALSLMVSITMFVLKIKCTPLRIAMLFIGTILNCIVLIMELQMILGGRAVELSENDYALGAYMLYTSIIQIFLHLLRLLGYLDD